MPNRLFIDEIISVGGVGAGDNPGAEISFFKKLEESAPKVTSHAKIKKSSAESAPTRGGNMPELDLSAFDLDDEVVAEINKQVAALIPDEPDVTKGLPDEVQEIIKAERERAEALEKRLDDEIRKRRTVEFVEKAKPLEVLLGKADEIGAVFEELDRLAPEAFAKLSTALDAAKARDSLASLLTEKGIATAEVDPIAKRDAWIVKQREAGRTEQVEVLRAEFWSTHPSDRDALRS